MYTKIGSQILFYYKVETIVDRLQMYSAYPVRSLVETEKQPINKQELIILADDTTLIYSESDRAIAKIYNLGYKLSKAIPDSLLKRRDIAISIVDETLPDPPPITDNPVTPTPVMVYGFRIGNKMAYTEGLIPMLDTFIEEMLISNILVKWYTSTRQSDLLKIELSTLADLQRNYINSLTELYKPLIPYYTILPEYQQEIITVNSETDEIISTETGETGYEPPTVTQQAEVLYYPSYSNFPLTGNLDIIYVDRTAKQMYLWNGTTYELYTATAGTFSLPFYDVSYVIVEHGLGKYMPTVQMIDAEGEEWEIDTEPVDINIMICQWNGNKTGTLYFS